MTLDEIKRLIEFLREQDVTEFELDYDGVSGLFTWDELDNDRSAAEVQESVKALAEGDLGRAVELYQSVSNRWAEVRSHESLN